MYWNFELVKYPCTEEMVEEAARYPGRFHAELTRSGYGKIEARATGNAEKLIAGLDYHLKTAPDDGTWLAFPDVAETRQIRDVWIMQRLRRPRDPSFQGCPMPRSGEAHQERNAQIITGYFRPFTAYAAAADRHVRCWHGEGDTNVLWHAEMLQWFDGGVLTLQMQRVVQNFLAVTQARPVDGTQGEAHDEDIHQDEPAEVGTADLEDVLRTTRRRDGSDEESDSDVEAKQSRKQQEEAMALGRDVWSGTGRAKGKISEAGAYKQYHSEREASIKHALELQRNTDGDDGNKDREDRTGSCQEVELMTATDMEEWFETVKARQGAAAYNTQQLEMAQKVLQQICGELRGEVGEPLEEPLLWLLHGGPGVGKSHVLKLIREMLEKAGYVCNVHFMVVALQAVMADQLCGDTLHHAAGLTPSAFKKTNASNKTGPTKRQQEVSTLIRHCRWLIIDEISMISAQLLAELDTKFRRMMQDIQRTKKDAQQIDRAFGGLNVVLCGDFWQLDPPSGTALSAVPTEFIRDAREFPSAPDARQGQWLLWGREAGCVQGVTELTQCMRVAGDKWLLQVQEEMRGGRMSADTHAFLHGQPTAVPGCYMDGDQKSWCQSACHVHLEKCRCLGTEASKEYIKAHECVECQEERRKRVLVATARRDEPFKQERFRRAAVIFPNNNVKYDVNKQRAKEYAAETGQGITWACAHDSPCQRVIRGRRHLKEDKRRWLTWHDRDCGELYGMLPLVPDMPVMLQDHLSRSPKCVLLRGKIGKIHSWVLHDKEQSQFHDGQRVLQYVPKVVYVKFEGASWHVRGTPEPGIYPVRPWMRTWFIDKNRKQKVLGVRRFQVPLGPAFAITAHASQGQTLEAAIVDLQQGVGVSTIASYVAMTRVKRREDLLIYRPFDRDVFTTGAPLGPTLLLQWLRGEAVDWEAVGRKLAPKRRCVGCREFYNKQAYTGMDWRSGEMPWCKYCIEERNLAGTPLLCCRCNSWKAGAEYNQWTLGRGRGRFCKECVGREQRECAECKRRLCEQAFGSTWDEEDDARRCQRCRTHAGKFPCSQCKEGFTRQGFTANQWSLRAKRRCINCVLEGETRMRQQNEEAARAAEQVEKECKACRTVVQMLVDDARTRENIRRSAWVCESCRSSGYTARNVETYTCQNENCGRQAGHNAFPVMDLDNYRRKKTLKLLCKECKGEAGKRGPKGGKRGAEGSKDKATKRQK